VLCHGQGDPEHDGCCWVEGEVCPLRWKIEGGQVLDASGRRLGSIPQAAAGLADPGARGRVVAQLTGPRIVCRAALEVIAADPGALTDRARLNAGWDAHPDYQALVRPAWRRLEDREGLEEGSYQCSTWAPKVDPADGGGCCWGEQPAVNEASAAKLHAQAVQVRRAGGR